MSTSPADPVANPTASATASPGQANPTTGGFIGLRIGVLTVSDTRTEAEDVSGKRLVEALESAGHDCAEKAGRDGTPEAIEPLLDKVIDGFGELFRVLSYEEIGTSSLQSRALAGVANATFVFVLPGSSGCILTSTKLL